MKKTISIFTTLIVLTTIIFSNTLSAFAETTSKYWEPRPNCQDSLSYVNDEINYSDIESEYDNENDAIIFRYAGKGNINSWEFPLSQEGKDYEIVSQNDNNITIKLINENHELPYINALVDFNETSTSETTTKFTTQTTIKSIASTTEQSPETTANNTENTVSSVENKNVSQASANSATLKTDNQNSNKLTIPCIILFSICLVIIVTVFVKKHKK